MSFKISDLPSPHSVLTKEGCPEFVVFSVGDFAGFISKLEMSSQIDEYDYLTRYPDVANAVQSGAVKSGMQHYLLAGYFEGRAARVVEVTTVKAPTLSATDRPVLRLSR